MAGLPQLRFLINHRAWSLFTSLSSLLLVAAFAQNTWFTDELFLIALCMILVSSLYAVEKLTTHLFSFMIAGVVAIGGNILGYIVPGPEADVAAAAISLVFLTWVMYLLGVNIFTKQVINFNTIIGAVCLYILIGIAFGFLYLIVDFVVPNSFQLVVPHKSHGIEAFLDRFCYYSFVTMMTVGYGDIMPISQSARYFSVIESLIAQLYLTILMARLVGMHLNQAKEQ